MSSPLLRCGAALLSAVAFVSPSYAQPSSPILARAHAELEHYDVHGERTLEMIRGLGDFLTAHEANSPGVEHEATFLRAIVATDLWLLAESEARRVAIADAIGASPEDAEAALRTMLEATQAGVYASIASDGLRALDIFDGDVRADTVGTRSAFARLRQVERAYDADRTIEGLAAVASDPCESDAPCEGIVSHFDAQGRRAVHAVERGFRAVARIASVPEGADPFVDAIAPQLVRAIVRFRSTWLSPEPRLDATQLSPAGPRAQNVNVQGLVTIEATRVCAGSFANVRFTEDRAVLVPRVAGMPTLPDSTCVPLPASYRPFPGPLDGVTESFARFRGARMAIGGSPQVQSHVLTRVFMSASRAGLEGLALAGRADDGRLAAVPVSLRRGEDGSAIQVYLRLGGHTVSIRGSGERVIPRQRTPSGFSFDYPALSAVARSTRSTSLRYMHSVPLESLVTTAFHVASNDGLTFVLP